MDFNQIFAMVMKSMAFRVLFAIAPFFGFDINLLIVKTALLYNLIEQLVYVEIENNTKYENSLNIV